MMMVLLNINKLKRMKMEVCILLHTVRQLTLIEGVIGTKSNATNKENVRDDSKRSRDKQQETRSAEMKLKETKNTS